jgi:hypothetical protein
MRDMALETTRREGQASIVSLKNGATEALSKNGGTVMRTYYVVNFVYLSKKQYCVWYTNDVDGLMVKGNQVLCFDDVNCLKSYCYEHKIELDLDDDYVDSYDTGTIFDWLNGKTPGFDYVNLLNFWNMTSDVAKSVSVDFYGDTNGIVLDVYRKVFYANNIPVLKKNGEDFIPIWEEEELLELKKVMQDAVRIVCKFCFQIEIDSSDRLCDVNSAL